MKIGTKYGRDVARLVVGSCVAMALVGCGDMQSVQKSEGAAVEVQDANVGGKADSLAPGGLLCEAGRRWVVSYNYQASLQRNILGDDRLPTTSEFRVEAGDRGYVAQLSESRSGASKRLYYVEIGDWANVDSVDYGEAESSFARKLIAEAREQTSIEVSYDSTLYRAMVGEGFAPTSNRFSIGEGDDRYVGRAAAGMSTPVQRVYFRPADDASTVYRTELPEDWQADCESDPTAGSIELAADRAVVQRDYRISGPNSANQYTATYFGTEWHSTTLPLLKVTNPHGLTLWFIYDGSFNAEAGEGTAPYGARLYQATLNGRELLYNNQRGKVSPNWGPRYPGSDEIQGWIGLGGAESCFPVHEHGFYAAVDWDYAYRVREDGAFVFTSEYTGDPEGNGSRMLAVKVSYVVPADGTYWKTRIEILNPGPEGKHFQYWHNYLLPAGDDREKHRYEVLLPEVERIEVHSTGDDGLKTSGRDNGAHSLFEWEPGRKVSTIHGPQGSQHADSVVQGWLGFFNHDPNGRNRVSRYAFYDHNRKLGLGMVDADGERSFYPKGFGGAGIGTGNWTDAGERYVEMWYSPVVRTFWENATLAADKRVVHESIQFPLERPGALEAFDPARPASYRLGQPGENGDGGDGDDESPDDGGDGPLDEHFQGPGQPAADGTTTGTHDEDWAVWYDGEAWGSGYRVALEDGAQTIALRTGSFGIERTFGDIGGKTMTIDHRFDGPGWYEILAAGEVVFRKTDSFDGEHALTLPPGANTLRIKVGSSDSSTVNRAVVSDIRIR